MQEKKTKRKKATKIVQVCAELLEDVFPSDSLAEEQLPVSLLRKEVSETMQPESKIDEIETSEESKSAQMLEPVPEIQTPLTFLKNSALPAAKFVLIPLICLFLSDLLFPLATVWILNNSYVRTAVLCAFIWNLIGAVLFARAREGKHIIIWYFAVPLATAWMWAIPLLIIVSVLSYWLPPNLR